MRFELLYFFLWPYCVLLVLPLSGQSPVAIEDLRVEVSDVSNAIFINDKVWRGADGAASIDLENGNILWLFSDTFINPRANGKRSGSRVINNSIAIQEGHALQDAAISFYYAGSRKHPKSFFELPGKTWFWTGHGALVRDKLVIFLFEEQSTHTGIGFEAISWYVAIIDNPYDPPRHWNVTYVKGSDTFRVIVGSSAVLKDADYIYAYSVQEPSSHEVYLLRMPIDKLVQGDITEIEWWSGGNWHSSIEYLEALSPLFIGQTEFSVHYQEEIHQYVQIQTFGFGKGSLGYRLASRPEGPWSAPVLFYTPTLDNDKDFIYSANAHPEITADGVLVTYNVNTEGFAQLVKNENIYFPKIVRLKFLK